MFHRVEHTRELTGARYEVVPNPTLINSEFAGNTGWNTTGTVPSVMVLRCWRNRPSLRPASTNSSC